ncbi:mucin-16-like isoform X4 [Hemitrygon akajei]|uniref:mucin-16-like isoform X4 n=1 Tax=Hemitrygon akajei TaxID=2704970 RepID=UPI003BF94841
MFSRTFFTKALLWNILICWLYTTASSELASEEKETSSKITSNLKEIKTNLQKKNVVEAFPPADTNTKGERTRERKDNIPTLAEHQNQSSTSSPIAMENEPTQGQTAISDRSAHQQQAPSSSPTMIAAATTPTSSPKIIVAENIPTQEQLPACKLPIYQHGSSSLTTAAVASEEASSIQYNISFIVNKLTFEEVKSNPAKPATKIATELTDLFMSSNIKATFIKCMVNIFREVMNDSTRVAVNCSFKNESETQGVNKEHVYDVLKEETRNSSRLGPYELKKHIYVNGYTEFTTAIVPEEETHPIHYYVAFNVRKPSYQEIQSKSTEQGKLITAELTDLFLNSSINATFLNCIFYSFRAVIDDSTRVTANCSFKNETGFQGVIRERVYEVVVKKTNDMSNLGTYELEKNSLYVSDQLEIPSTIVPEEETNPIHYYVAFNVRKPSYQEIQSKSTEQAKLITAELTDLFLNSSINATFLNCIFYSFREVIDDSTRVTANCSFKNETGFQGVIRERVYEVVVKKTNDMSNLGTYELEKNSLYVSDQLEIPSTIVPEEETNPIHYYVAFNVRKPSYQEIQSKSTEQAKLITAELTDLFLNSSINATFLNCIFYSFREVIDDSTRVTANCSFKNETGFQGVIRERVYEVVVKKTNDMSNLGTYELEKNSLYVSDQLEIPSTIVPEEETNPIHYYVAFNVRKPSYQEIQSKSTEQAKLITAELTDLFLNSSINATFLNCIFYSFREVIDDSTRVTANCSFKNETGFQGVIRERVYEVVVKKTNDMSNLGTYELEKNSLYVSDQLEIPSTIVPEEETNPIHYYVAFNVRKPSYQEIQSKSTEQAKLITAELTDLFLNSSINATFLNCIFYSFREVIDDSTRVTANCSFKNETGFQGVIRERVYEVVVKKTNDMSNLGTYELEKNSLYVSDQLEIPSTIVPEEETNPIHYYVAFNVRKPSYQEIQSKSTEQAKLITAELTDLFLNSSINATFLNCIFYSFREVIDDSTRVTANCSFKNETGFQGVIRERVYEVVVKKTNDMSNLGTYELEKNSLYVSDQLEIPSTIVPEEETNPIHYYVAFNVRKPSYQEIQSKSTEQAKLITAELTDLFLNSSINATFLNCIFYSFREVIDDSTRVTANCSFKNETGFQGVIRERVYVVVVKKTNDMSNLGTYELEKNSLYVSDQLEIPSTIVPEEETNPIQYYVAFNVMKPSYQEIQSNFTEQAKLITAELTDLFLNSSINATFLNCVLYSFREVIDDSTRVTANCSFKNETGFQGVIRERVYVVVVKKTNDMSNLGTYELEKNSLYVSDQMELPSTIVPEEETNPIQYYVAFNVKKPSYQEIQSNSTEQAKLITAELTDLFLNSSINATFLNCVFYSFREVIDDSTRVTANCSFKNETDFEGVIRERVYQVVVKKTNDMSNLGTYELEKNSLYVSDQLEIPSTIGPVKETNPILYSVSFIVNKPIFQEIQANSSENAKVISAELTDLFLNSSINATFLKCVVHSFREVMDDSTRVTANCSFKNETDTAGINREHVYEVFRKKTSDVSELGSYELEKHSLSVDGHMEIFPPTVTVPVKHLYPIYYNVTFVVNKLTPEEFESNTTEKASMISAELTDLFKNSKINTTFIECAVESFRKVMDDSTRVTANCSFKNESLMKGIDRERVYDIFKEETSNMSTLGSYDLEKHSLYVNDYQEIPPPAITVPVKHLYPIYYNVTFVVNKLTPEEIESNTTEKASMISAELTDLFKNSKINRTFIECAVESFRTVMNDSTRVTANCSFKNESLKEGIDRERVYDIFKEETSNISTLGSYDLENYSLYVNDYRQIPPHIISGQTPVEFNVTFSITNLEFIEALHDNTSQLYQSASTVVTQELNTMFRNSELKETFVDCKMISLRVISQKTKIYAICTFKNSANEQIDRVTVYQQFSKNTENLSALGPYLLDHNSLYVDDYNESTPPTEEPNQSGSHLGFNVTFTITNLPYMEALHNQISLLYQSASLTITKQLTALFENSKINTTFVNCSTMSLSATSSYKTKVYAVCSFKETSDEENVDRIIVYQQFRYKTKNLTVLGPYSIDKNSLFVNDYHESAYPTNEPPISAETQHPSLSQPPLCFNLSFIATKLPYSSVLLDPTSQVYRSASSNCIQQLNGMFRNSSISAAFWGCTNVSFSNTNEGLVKVLATCLFKDNVQKVDNVIVDQVFRDGTNNTSNTIYGLLTDNLQVTGCKEPEAPTTVATTSQEVPTVDSERQGDLTFQVNFTIMNINFTDNLLNSSSSEYTNLTNSITKQMTELFRKNSLKKSHKFCRVTELSPGPGSPRSVNVFTTCFFDPVKETESITENRIKSDFETGTDNLNWLGQFRLSPESFSVAAASPVTGDRIELPYWAIIVIVLGILLALLLLMILGCLIALCIKKKFHGFYNLLQNPFGIYYSHLDGKK